MRRLRYAIVAVVVMSGLVVVASPAHAACHRFTFVSLTPNPVAEGATLTVTVDRDATVNPSSVQVTSVDETAKAGEDYPRVQQTISFTTEDERTFTIAITDDTRAEPAETFRLHLSNGGGCAVNPNFQYGDDKQVTIAASDAATPTTAAPAPTTAPPAAPVTTRAPAATTTALKATTTTAATEETTSTVAADTTVADTTAETLVALQDTADDDDDDDSSGGVIAALVIAILAVAGAIAYLLYRRRSAMP